MSLPACLYNAQISQTTNGLLRTILLFRTNKLFLIHWGFGINHSWTNTWVLRYFIFFLDFILVRLS